MRLGSLLFHDTSLLWEWVCVALVFRTLAKLVSVSLVVLVVVGSRVWLEAKCYFFVINNPLIDNNANTLLVGF